MGIFQVRTITILSFLLWNCGLSGQSDLPKWAQERFKTFQKDYSRGTFITPSFLQADFSGDKKADLAILIERKSDQKKGILILFAQSDKSFIVGSGNTLDAAGDDFKWADTWEVFTEKETYETTFTNEGDVAGGREIKLERPAISLWQEEGSGGLIYFNGRKFVWIHQGD
ncbi:hypothetical protein KK083_18470 [Fulvivirgaceae bacterium PWU4]|uniref:VCBS repeat-containing protein n=1 Tax=Chryseosolibacter histidini TaxID=2782349 RepID=A0AAP2DM86_9BACT|nr:hypothetical protein [Chryseosolibacter histidini]MBT1698885.1 hypothetical protein [Chryseosolibacter histidini]